MKKLNTLTPGTLHSSQELKYKTKDGRAVFAFSYENTLGGYYDIVIHDQPDFNGRDERSTIAHWLPCNESPINRKVCLSYGKEPKTLEKAKKISMEYSELLWTYIRSGISIDDQIKSRN